MKTEEVWNAGRHTVRKLFPQSATDAGRSFTAVENGAGDTRGANLTRRIHLSFGETDRSETLVDRGRVSRHRDAAAPASLPGIPAGELSHDRRADVVLLDEKWQPVYVFCGGKRVLQKAVEKRYPLYG